MTTYGTYPDDRDLTRDCANCGQSYPLGMLHACPCNEFYDEDRNRLLPVRDVEVVDD